MKITFCDTKKVMILTVVIIIDMQFLPFSRKNDKWDYQSNVQKKLHVEGWKNCVLGKSWYGQQYFEVVWFDNHAKEMAKF